MTREEGKLLIEARVEEFHKNEAILKKKGHGETNIRTNYIDVLFEALGWNMKSHHEVVREFSQKDNAATKKVDYAFKINGKLKFFVEAKEASVDLVNNKEAIYQAKRYAYSTNGRAPIVVLTDFEEFRVFNVLKAPNMDNPERDLLKERCMVYREYVEKWDLLWQTFSKEAVAGGSLDTLRGKVDKNTKLMDAEFLDQITDWRETLAKNIAIRNGDLNEDEINEAVQRILDRLLFIRNLEDRQIEPENTLLDIAKLKENVFSAIIPLFRKLDTVYNGLLFKEHFSEKLAIDDKTLVSIIKNMSYPLSPFQFDVIEPEILGRIYEKFLGSKIRLTAGHQAKVEEKIEVRKAGGVYYTPEYIVNYIVENTVGKKIEGLAPDDVKAIKIVDPACGSGSFLLGAFSYLLDYHTKWYASHKSDKKYKSDYYITESDELKITLDKRSDILKNNIFGVDIDQEATEVAIMSLYLKMLDEGYDLGQRSLFFGKGHVLPDMTNNVKCGNSLIGFDYFDQKVVNDENVKKELFNEMKEIKPFDWKDEFPDIFKNGGFDCVVGNPPYTYMITENQQKYFSENYKYQDYQKDLYLLFFERYHLLLKEYCLFGIIISNTWLQSITYRKIRQYLATQYCWRKILTLPEKVFDAVVDTHVLIFEKDKNNSKCIFQVQELRNGLVNKLHDLEMSKLPNNGDPINVIFNSTQQALYQSILKKSCILKEISTVYNGIKPFEKGKGIPPQTEKTMKDKPFVQEGEKPDPNWTPLLRGSLINRYIVLWDNNYWVLYGEWLAAPRDPSIFTKEKKIMIRQTGDSLIATIVPSPFIARNNLHVVIFDDSSKYHLNYVLGLINSKLLGFYYSILNPEKGEALAEVKKAHVEQLPIMQIEFDNVEEKLLHDSIVSHVDQMLQAQKDSRSAKSDADKKLFEKSIAMLDRKIDSLVYQLYGLTDDEIKIVEGS